jgi:UDP-N-acetylglucosamine/UDP-N-acetylgalactosamine diphosphorylase
MSTQKNLENVQKLLKRHGQSHLLAFWEQLDASQRCSLLAQIQRLDFTKIDQWVRNFVTKSDSAPIGADFSPPPFYGAKPAGAGQQRQYSKALELGGKSISAGKVAAFVVAGGQGTRLGFDGPKGDFPISPVKNKTLFQIFADTIAAVSQKYQTVCPWYIMTSPLNHSRTIEIFRSNDYYGLDAADVFIFQQDTLPNFSLEGKILLADKANIACSPDGHGGSLKALCQSGALADMKRRGVEFLSYWQVDNPLVNIFDPLFIGLHTLDEAQMSSKAVIKAGPKEKVGNFCLIDGRIAVIEYGDLPDKLAARRNPDGSLAFQLGSIAIHIISRAFVEKLNAKDSCLPLHRAVKKIPHIDEQGNLVASDGIKLESFVFDAIPLAAKSIILETLRSEEFAPTKNAAGADSVETTRQMMVARAAAWLEAAGAPVPRKADGSVDCLLEIAPSFALEKEDVREKLNQIPKIKPGDRIYLEAIRNTPSRLSSLRQAQDGV